MQFSIIMLKPLLIVFLWTAEKEQ